MDQNHLCCRLHHPRRGLDELGGNPMTALGSPSPVGRRLNRGGAACDTRSSDQVLTTADLPGELAQAGLGTGRGPAGGEARFLGAEQPFVVVGVRHQHDPVVALRFQLTGGGSQGLPGVGAVGDDHQCDRTPACRRYLNPVNASVNRSPSRFPPVSTISGATSARGRLRAWSRRPRFSTGARPAVVLRRHPASDGIDQRYDHPRSLALRANERDAGTDDQHRDGEEDPPASTARAGHDPSPPVSAKPAAWSIVALRPRRASASNSGGPTVRPVTAWMGAWALPSLRPVGLAEGQRAAWSASAGPLDNRRRQSHRPSNQVPPRCR